MRLIKSLYFKRRFYYALAVIAVVFLISYWSASFYGLAWILIYLMGLLLLVDLRMLYAKAGLLASRKLPERLSNGDSNEIAIEINNAYSFPIQLTVIDELPIQFQRRDFHLESNLSGKQAIRLNYLLRPVSRGEYSFGQLNCYSSSPIGLVSRRYKFDKEQGVKVYPSYIQMKQYDFLAMDNKVGMHGLKKIRRIGHTMEFEQIKEYVRGDDVRTVNWKATAKQNQLMVNQYQDEKMQPIYSVIDTSRTMKMPFEGLSLLDYAINSCLAFSNVGLKKGDKVGLVEFSSQLGAFLPATAKKTYLNVIMDALYRVDTAYTDTDYGLLQTIIKKRINHRSLIFLYTNFEHPSSLERQLPYLQAIAKRHVMVVIFFENTELQELSMQEAQSGREIVEQTIARQFEHDKRLMVRTLQQRGIQTILTAPSELTVNTINKYLEIKARGLI
nr:DUF58 domain-containing protein [Aureitalea marina]